MDFPRTAQTYGNLPVPWTVSWSSEDRFYVGKDSVGRHAVCQSESPGFGKPVFSKPHMQRQRKCIVERRCDLCGKSLRNRTRVSLSNARPTAHAFRPGDILQVEPMVHKRCALISLSYCPALRRQIADGIVRILQVTCDDVQLAVLDEDAVESFTGERRKAIGHAKVWIKRFNVRDLDWIGFTGASHD